MPTVKLYNEKFSGGGSASGKLNPSLLSAGAAANIRAPQMNINAANVNYRGPQAAQIQAQALETSLKSGAAFTDTLTKSAFAYQKRQDVVIADHAVLEYTNELRDSYYGKADESGRVSGGYGNLRELDASTGYGGFEEDVTSRMKDRLDGLTPQQKQFAAIRMHQSRNGYLTKASAHASAQLQAAEAGMNDRGFNSVMEDISTGITDIGSMQSSLGKYAGNEEERKKRDTQMTKHALYSTLNTQGPAAAKALAMTLQQTPGVGDGTAIYDFMNTVKTDQRQDRAEQRAEANYQRTLKSARKTEQAEVADDIWATGFSAALNANDGSVRGVISAMEKTGLSPANLQDKIETKVSGSIKDGWDNAALMGEGGVSMYKEKVLAQLDELPQYVRDDVVRQLDELQARDIQKVIDGNAQADKIRKNNVATKQRGIDDQLANLNTKARGSGRQDPAIIDDAKEIYNNPNITDSQRTRLDRIINGTGNPFEDVELVGIEEDWAQIVDNPAQLDSYDISETKRAELEKRLRIDRASSAAPMRKTGLTELMSYYKLKKSAISGILEPVDQTTGLNAEEAKRNFAQTSNMYNSLVDGYLAKDASPGEAVQKALGVIMGDDVVRSGMTGLPQGTSRANKDSSVSDKMTYADDHTAILNSFTMRQIPSLAKGGDVNIVTFAQNVGNKWTESGGTGENPQTTVANRIVEVYNTLDALAATTNDPTQLIEIQRLIKNHTAQSEYVQDLIPEAAGPYQTSSEVGTPTDGDTWNGTRSPGLGAAEMTNPDGTPNTQGAIHQNKMERLLGALSPSGVYKFNVQPGSGLYKRPIGTTNIGSANVDVIAREEMGFPSYEEGQAIKGRN